MQKDTACIKRFLLLSEGNCWESRRYSFLASEIRHKCTHTYTQIKCCRRRQWHSQQQQQQQPPGRTAGSLISISWMWLCTFISTSEWHFHRNYWANQLTSDGSGLDCNQGLGYISSVCFVFTFECVCGKEVAGAIVHSLMCENCAPVVYWLGSGCCIFLKDYHYDILCLPHWIQCRLSGEWRDW